MVLSRLENRADKPLIESECSGWDFLQRRSAGNALHVCRPHSIVAVFDVHLERGRLWKLNEFFEVRTYPPGFYRLPKVAKSGRSCPVLLRRYLISIEIKAWHCSDIYEYILFVLRVETDAQALARDLLSDYFPKLVGA